ncbi:hypothetical protein TOK_5149 [Pseudonocardia sp. N23]|nr:hypothetical protein TOK_5149 [Pseudonocardia sp. N23]
MRGRGVGRRSVRHRDPGWAAGATSQGCARSRLPSAPVAVNPCAGTLDSRPAGPRQPAGDPSRRPRR